MRQLLWVWMLLMALAFVNDRCHCCLQEERNSLLEIKAWFSHAGGAGFSGLRGWDKEDLNCCNWDRVACDNTTNRVIELDLSFINYHGLEDLYLNASLFLPFNELESLDLSQNHLVCGLKNQGFQGLASGLRKLKDLGLSNNKFNDNILSSLSGFSTLESLDLSHNNFTGTVGLRGFQGLASGLRKLEVLRLNNNKFNDSILSSLSGLSTLVALYLSDNCFTGAVGLGGLASGLRKLEELTLSNNKFNDSILPSLSGFSTLKYLHLSNNSFTGTIGLHGLRKLEILFVDSIDFKENILLESLGGLPSLKTLSASYSKFEGKHFGKGLCNSTSLEEIDLIGSSLPASFLGSIGTLSTLKVLDLTEVDLHDTLPAQALENLTKLEELFLYNASPITTSFLRVIGSLSALRTLSLERCMLSGTLPHQALQNLTKLEELFLDNASPITTSFLRVIGSLPALRTLSLERCMLSGTLQALQNLTKLEELFLDNASPITTSFLRVIGSLPALRTLSLERCMLSGTLPHQGWCELKNLEHLHLAQNNLKGVLPPCLGNLSSLRYLDLSHNQFKGNIAFSHLSHLPHLEHLSISDNYFQVPISFGSFMNHSNLKYIACDNNELVPASSFQAPTPKLQLLFFNASTCTSKLLSVGFPNFLRSQYDLELVDLSHNKFIGEPFPSWLVENNTKLNQLYLRNTSFIGPLQLPQNPRPNLHTIDLSDNNIHGQIARNTCLIFPSLEYFMMANNNLTGCIPRCFGNMSSLVYLDLSNNHMSCELLEHNLPKGGSSLQYLKLSNNNFQGLLPPSVFNLTNLIYLFLDGNKFVGEVPGTFAPTLQIVDISNNLLSGMLPRGIGNSSIYPMKGIDLSKNHFEGTIPIEYFSSHRIQFLDLSENNLSGSLPLGYYAPSLRYVHLYKNQLSGPLPYAFFNLSSLVTLDLGDNSLTGPIPGWIDSLSELSIFDLKSNQFKGELPRQLCFLRKLSILDLSENNFSGHLPSCLSNLNFATSYEKSFVFYSTVSEDDLDNKMVSAKIDLKIVVELTAKKNFYTYEGDILRDMSAMDLSCNRFTGEIPPEWGNLSGIFALNLSQNNLTGLIPSSFSNLKRIESLDLSHNNLNGRIPAQLIELTFLAVFNVSYNNLSGRTPDMKNQFGTFDESCYKGNPLLCGPLLQNSCNKTESPSERVPDNSNGDDGSIDMDSFYVSFGVCYIIMVLTILAVLCINPHWRRRWFYFIEDGIDTCYCVLAINFRKFFRSRR